MNRTLFRKRPDLRQESEYRLIPVPRINHPSRTGWENDAHSTYEEIFGKSITTAPHDLPIPFPEDTFGERLSLGMKTGLLKTMFSLLSLFTKQRGTHHNGGVGATGRIRFLTNDQTSRLPFCQSGEELPVSIRHSNASFEDDGCSQLRAMAFRIHLKDGGSEDFLLSTGAILPFWSVASLLNFAGYRNKVKDDNWSPQKTWLENSPTAFVGAIEAARLAPECYTKMSYYSGIPYGIRDSDVFVKFRVMPHDMDRESGLLTTEQQRRIWIQNRIDQNEQPLHYLAQTFRDRLTTGPVRYTLEAQFRTLDPSRDTAEFFNLSRYWDDEVYPWVPVAEITGTSPMDDRSTENLAFWLGNVPRGLDFMDGYSAHDYNSVATSRTRIYPRAQRLRRKGSAASADG